MTDADRGHPPRHATVEHLPEGDEEPPPGTGAMSIVRWALVAVMAAVALASWVHVVAPGQGAATDIVSGFHCPMHPTVLQERPGACPICGMDLVPVSTGSPSAQGTAPAGGGAGLDRRPAGGAYWCPMHPDVASDDPNSTCTKCGGMKLIPRERAADRRDVAPPGLVPVDIPPDRAQLIGMRTARVQRQRLTPRLRTVGFVSAAESSFEIVTARFTGWIEQVRVRQSGQRVERGQVLALAYSEELISAQQGYISWVRWNTEKRGVAPVIPTTLYGDPRKRLELLGIAARDIDELARNLTVHERLPIRSPVSGHVARMTVAPGLYVQPGSELFRIADLSSVDIVADVHAEDVDRVRVGQPAHLVPASRPGQSYSGRVEFVYPAVSSESRTLQALVSLENPALELRPGMYGDVLIELPPADGLVVPCDAVVDTGEHQYVFLSRSNGRFEPRLVRVGASDGDRVEIVDGLVEGDVVVTTANFLVDSESRLRAAVETFRAPPEEEEPEERQREELERTEDDATSRTARPRS